MKFDSIKDVWQFLDAVPNFQKKGADAIKNGFEHISKFLKKLGNPHIEFPIIHVAGTNGKGTTCYLLEHIYTQTGYKTGLFTSPHLLSYNERVRVGAKNIEDAEMVRFFRKFGESIYQEGFSYFEISMLLAFWYFREQNVDIIILETGLGGRLDSTNIVKPILSIITSIGLDHQNILGGTEAEITHEKAGIIKPNTPVVIGNVSADNESIILKKASKEGSEVTLVRTQNPAIERRFYTDFNTQKPIKTVFIEKINRWNIAVVMAATKILENQFYIDREQIVKAIESFGGVAGRFEKLLPDKEWYFTGAHNYQALQSIMDSINENFTQKPVLIFSMMKDKVSMETIKLLINFEQRYFFQQVDERAATKELIHSKIEVKSIEEKNYQTILKELETELVIIAGSFYFYPIIKRWIKNYSKNTNSFLT